MPPAAPQCDVSITNVTGMPSRDSASAPSWYARSSAMRQAMSQPGVGGLHSMPIAPIDVEAHDARVQFHALESHS